MDVLFDRPGKYKNQIIGKSPYLQSVVVHEGIELIGNIKRVVITEAAASSISGELIDIDKYKVV
jgi:tRNA-2-methylthio-N6-dimethylallyladenosine synthase